MKSILVALSASLVAACATTTEPVRAPVNIEIQEAVGFTITEEARIGGDVRTDYETAVSYLEQGRQAEPNCSNGSPAAPWTRTPGRRAATGPTGFGSILP